MGLVIVVGAILSIFIEFFAMGLGHRIFVNKGHRGIFGALIGMVAGVGSVLGIFIMYSLLTRYLPGPEKALRWGKIAENAAAFTVLAVFIIILLFPYYWVVVTAFRPKDELIRLEDSLLWTENPTLDNFKDLLDKDAPPLHGAFRNWMKTSLTVSLTTTLFSLIIGTLAAYSLVRFKFPGARSMGMGMFITYLVPPILLLFPMMNLTARIELPLPEFTFALSPLKLGLSFETRRLYNSLWALILVYPTMLVPFSTWFLMGFFRSIPPDMEECARVDGATYWQAFYKVTLPLARPGIVSAGIFSFTLSWGEYLYARGLITSKNLWTLPVGVPSELTRGDVYAWGLIMAGAVLASLPITIVYSFLMQSFVSGLTAGAVKG